MLVEKITNMQKKFLQLRILIPHQNQIPKNKMIEIHGNAIEAACLEGKTKYCRFS